MRTIRGAALAWKGEERRGTDGDEEDGSSPAGDETSASAAPGGNPAGLHVAIIMDGNGRWAQARGLPRSAGHRAGGAAVRRVVEAAASHGIGTLTLYAFSSDNWKRPPDEVASLMRLFERYLRKETRRCVAEGVRVSVIGRRDRLSLPLWHAIRRTELATQGGRTLHLRLAVDYSARDAIARAASRWTGPGVPSRGDFAALLAESAYGGEAPPDVDLLIRTGGEQRLSDFLLWECAYAEIVFTPRLWPDFDAEDLAAALAEFERRERRFGGLAPVSPGRASTFSGGA